MEDHREIEQRDPLPEQPEESMAEVETEAAPLPTLTVETRVVSPPSSPEPNTWWKMC